MTLAQGYTLSDQDYGMILIQGYVMSFDSNYTMSDQGYFMSRPKVKLRVSNYDMVTETLTLIYLKCIHIQ